MIAVAVAGEGGRVCHLLMGEALEKFGHFILDRRLNHALGGVAHEGCQGKRGVRAVVLWG
jgi:hypothetical protein